MPHMKLGEVDDFVYSAIHYAIDEQNGIYDVDSIIKSVFNNSPVYYASNAGEIEEYIREHWLALVDEALEDHV